MMMKKLLAAALVASALCISGCSLIKPSEDPLFVAGEHSYSTSIGRIMAADDASRLAEEYGSDCWNTQIAGQPFEEYMRGEVQDHVSEILLFDAIAQDEGMMLDDAELKLAGQMADRYVAGGGKKNADVDKDDIRKAMEIYCLSVKYQESVRAAAESGLTSDDVRMIRGRQLEIRFSNDSERADAKRALLEVQQQLSSGKFTLNQLIPLYSNSEELDVTYYKDEAAEEWKKAFFDLQRGQMSNVVELDDRYIIFQCIDNEEKQRTKEHLQEVRLREQMELLETTKNKYAAEHTVDWNYEKWEAVDLSDLAGPVADNIHAIYRSAFER